MWKSVALTGLVGVALVLGSCSDDDSGGSEGNGNAGDAGAGGGLIGGSSGVSGSGAGPTVSRDGGVCEIKDDGSGCAGESYVGENVPLDIYVMFDQSGSTCS